MKPSVLVNNYNYGRFLGEAVESVLHQTHGDFELIVVDDGSTDDSESVIARYTPEARLRVVRKTNGGQLSCFSEGFRVSTGDPVFFLDADDAYEPEYLERALERYRDAADCDFLFCAYRYFGARSEVVREPYPAGSLGPSLVRTWFLGTYLGAPTSALSCRRAMVARILPVPREEEWRIDADNVLVRGASLVGAVKHYLPEPLVRYRLHDANRWQGRSFTAGQAFRNRLRKERLHHQFVAPMDSESIRRLAPLEFSSIPRASARILKQYAGILWSGPAPLSARVRAVLTLLRRFLSSRGSRPPRQ